MSRPTRPDKNSRPRRVRAKDLLPGDVFESDGMVVISVNSDPADATKVLIRFRYEEVEASYSTSARTKTLVRRPSEA